METHSVDSQESDKSLKHEFGSISSLLPVSPWYSGSVSASCKRKLDRISYFIIKYFSNYQVEIKFQIVISLLHQTFSFTMKLNSPCRNYTMNSKNHRLQMPYIVLSQNFNVEHAFETFWNIFQ